MTTLVVENEGGDLTVVRSSPGVANTTPYLTSFISNLLSISISEEKWNNNESGIILKLTGICKEGTDFVEYLKKID